MLHLCCLHKMFYSPVVWHLLSYVPIITMLRIMSPLILHQHASKRFWNNGDFVKPSEVRSPATSLPDTYCFLWWCLHELSMQAPDHVSNTQDKHTPQCIKRPLYRSAPLLLIIRSLPIKDWNLVNRHPILIICNIQFPISVVMTVKLAEINFNLYGNYQEYQHNKLQMYFWTISGARPRTEDWISTATKVKRVLLQAFQSFSSSCPQDIVLPTCVTGLKLCLWLLWPLICIILLVEFCSGTVWDIVLSTRTFVGCFLWSTQMQFCCRRRC